MNNVFKYIGVITLAIVMLGIPVLCALSLVLSWPWFIFAILFFLTVLDIFAFISILCKFAAMLGDDF